MERCLNCHHTPCSCLSPEDLFGSPFLCQRRKITHKFASPNSPLDQEELDELQACIEAANDLLRSLGTRPDENNTRQLQLHFLEMRGVIVSAQMLCGCSDNANEETLDDGMMEHVEDDFHMVQSIWLEGKIVTAGRDFLQLNQNGATVFVPYRKLLSVKRCSDPDMNDPEPDFLNADQNVRRQLAFNFGEFVSKQPEYLNLFFGIFLFKQLKRYVGKDVRIFTEEGPKKGLLTNVDEGSATILNKGQKQQINLAAICYLKVFNLK